MATVYCTKEHGGEVITRFNKYQLVILLDYMDL